MEILNWLGLVVFIAVFLIVCSTQNLPYDDNNK